VKLKLDITPDLVAAMAAEVAAGERAVTAAMREASTGLKSSWRTQITGAGLGRRLANSIRNQTFPRAGESLEAAALVWSKDPVVVGSHDTGPLIRSKDGFYLAIELLSNLVFEGFGSCGDLVRFGFNSVFERDACDDFGEVVKAA